MREKNKPILEGVLTASEATMDALCQGEVFASVPVIGTALALLRTRDVVRERSLVAKMIRFFDGAGSMSAEEIESMKRLIDSNDGIAKVGEVVMLTLDKLTDLDKAGILGMVFRALVDGKIDATMTRRLARAVDVAFFDDRKRSINHALEGRAPW